MSQYVLVMTILLLGPVGLVAAADQADDIAAVEKGLFQDAKGPRWTLQERMERYKVPGVSIAVVRQKKVAWAKGYGLAEAATMLGVDVETLFQAASMSKPIAALIALILADQGRLDIDEDVNKYLKRWKVPAGDFKESKVTVR